MPENVNRGILVTAEYRLTDEEGEVLDHSDQNGPLQYIHGAGNLLPALEQALEGLVVGDAVRVTLTPEHAFGPYRPELVFETNEENLPDGIDIRPGTTFAPGGQQGRFSMRVVELTEKGALLDGNHPYAGKTLTWELAVTELGKPENTTPPNAKSIPIRTITSG